LLIYSDMENRLGTTVSVLEPSTSARIVSSARKRFEKFGFRRTSVADIAKDAGLAVGTLYGHFTSKEEILLSVMEKMNVAWLAAAQKVLKQPGSAPERLARLGEASIENNARNKLLNSVLSRDTEMIPAPLLEPLHRADVDQNVAMIADVIRDGIREGTFQAIDAEKAAFVLFTSGEAVYRQALHPYREIQPVLSQLTLRGLLQRGKDAAAPKRYSRRPKR
jgi:AcrR family transcriptional regulator